jgi:putative membrane protein
MTAILLVPVWGLMGLAFWILLIGLIVLITRGMPTTARDSRGSAVRPLDERYARGEITREEFLERRAVLDGTARDAMQ